MLVTIEQILSWHPCKDYATEGLLLEVSRGRREMDLLDILLGRHVSAEYRIWVGVHALPTPMVANYVCDCAYHVLHIYERQFPGDRQPRAAIEAARMWNDGLISDAELIAARAMAAMAARVAICKSTEAAAYAAYAAFAACATWTNTKVFRDTARARSIARIAVRDAIRSSRSAGDAWDAEPKWQIERLLKHYVKEL